MAEKKGGKTAERIKNLALPVCERLGLSLWDVCYEKEGATRYLRVLIDKEGGLDLSSCEEFSREFNEILDKEDPIDESYVFEAGSPGLNRELKREEHFKAFIGQKVSIKLYKAVNGEKELKAVLQAYDKNRKTIKLDGVETEILLSDCAYVRAADDDLF